jgi:hypothetical protein
VKGVRANLFYYEETGKNFSDFNCPNVTYNYYFLNDERAIFERTE